MSQCLWWRSVDNLWKLGLYFAMWSPRVSDKSKTLSSPCELRGLNSGLQVRWGVPLLAEGPVYFGF